MTYIQKTVTMVMLGLFVVNLFVLINIPNPTHAADVQVASEQVSVQELRSENLSNQEELRRKLLQQLIVILTERLELLIKQKAAMEGASNIEVIESSTDDDSVEESDSSKVKTSTEDSKSESNNIKETESNTPSGFVDYSIQDLLDSEPDVYEGYMNGNRFIQTMGISRTEAVANCELNAGNNPEEDIYCTWNGEVIYESN